MDLTKIKQPFTITLIGPPLVGKSSFVKNLQGAEFVVISMDDVLLDLHGGTDYNKAYSSVDDKLQDSEVSRQIIESLKLKKNIIFDMTNMRINRRRRNLGQCSSKIYTNIAIVFPNLSEETFIQRNESRRLTDYKFINMKVINQMISDYQPVEYAEGFNEIIYLKSLPNK